MFRAGDIRLMEDVTGRGHVEADDWAKRFADAGPDQSDKAIAVIMAGADPSDTLGRLQRLSPTERAAFFRLWHILEYGVDPETGLPPPDEQFVPQQPKSVLVPGSKWKRIVVVAATVVAVGTGTLIVTGNGADPATPNPSPAGVSPDPPQPEAGPNPPPEQSAGGEWVVEDPIGDISRAFDDLDPLENPDPAGDITVMRVQSGESSTTVNVRFNGAARELSQSPSLTFNAGLLIVFPDGRMIDIVWDSEGCKITDSSDAGDSIRCRWLDDGDLELTIEGWTPIPGTNLTFIAYQSGVGEVSSDSAELDTD